MEEEFPLTEGASIREERSSQPGKNLMITSISTLQISVHLNLKKQARLSEIGLLEKQMDFVQQLKNIIQMKKIGRDHLHLL